MQCIPELADIIQVTESTHVEQVQRQKALDKRHKDIRKKKNKISKSDRKRNRR